MESFRLNIVATCLESQRAYRALVGCVACWRTLDLSPKGGYERLMHGVSIMAEASLASALDLSVELVMYYGRVEERGRGD